MYSNYSNEDPLIQRQPVMLDDGIREPQGNGPAY